MPLLCCTPANSPRLPDKPWSWLVCAVGTLAFTIIIGLSWSYAVFMTAFMDKFDSSIEELSAVGSVSHALIFLFFPVSYKIIELVNFRISTMLSVILCASSLLATSFIEKNASILFITYSIPYGLGCSLLYASCVFAIIKYFKKRQNLAIGVLVSGFSLGLLILGPLLQVFIYQFGLKTAFWIMAGTVSCLLLPIFVMFDTNIKDDTVIEENQDEEEPRTCFTSFIHEYLVIFKRPAYLITLVIIFIQCFVTNMVLVHLVNYCIVAGMTAQQGANQLTVIGVMSLVSSILAGRIMDHKVVDPFHVNQAAAFIMAVSLFFIQLATKYYHFIIFSSFYGLGNGAFRTTIAVLFLNTVEAHLVKYAWPTAEVLTSIGNGAGAPFIGFIIDLTNSYTKGFAIGAGIMALSFLIPFVKYCKPRRKISDKHTHRAEVVLPASCDGFVAEIQPESLLSSNINYAYKDELTQSNCGRPFDEEMSMCSKDQFNNEGDLTEKIPNNNNKFISKNTKPQEVFSFDTKL